jgi:pimeloyl-ACP methyl ester carboxylesterase
MADFPFKESDKLQYNGPTLFVRGTKSKYVSDDTIPAIKKFFPNAQIVDVEAGHWLISENPEAFRQGNSLFSTIILNMFCLHNNSGRKVLRVGLSGIGCRSRD